MNCATARRPTQGTTFDGFPDPAAYAREATSAVNRRCALSVSTRCMSRRSEHPQRSIVRAILAPGPAVVPPPRVSGTVTKTQNLARTDRQPVYGCNGLSEI